MSQVMAAATHTAAASTSAPVASTAGSVFSMIVALALVLGLIMAIAWLLKRFAPSIVPANHSRLRVVASLSVGQKERVVVVQAGEQQLVLGVTAQSINLLEKLEQPLPEVASNSFPSLLAMLRKESV
jgi:flagellar protein FliO/FliZ